MKFTDRANIGKVKRTQEGYLVTQARAMRTGVQEYMAWEFGDTTAADGFDDNDIVRVYRPAESVFSKDSLQSAVHIPVTVDHPDVQVGSDNYADLAVGEVSTDVMRDGEFAAFSIMLKDKRGIDAYDSGKVELSMGYTAEMVRVEHKDYDYVMGKPSYNHIALVDKARAGSQARIGDDAKTQWGAAPNTTETKKEVTMTDLKTVVVGDKAVSIAAADADIITQVLKDHASALEAKDATIAELKIQCADADKKIKTDEDIAKMVNDAVNELTEVKEKAVKLVADYDATGKDAMTIRREVIGKVYGDEAVADLTTDGEIKAAFKVARVEEKADPVRGAMKDAKPKDKEDDTNGQAAYEARLNDSWKGAK
jgi:hypothetical protein